MEAVKRIEIVVPEVVLRELTALLEAHKVSGYTVTRGLSGKGHRGAQVGDGLSNEFNNAAVLVACEPTALTPLTEALRPLLKRYGGMCLISDAMSLKH